MISRRAGYKAILVPLGVITLGGCGELTGEKPEIVSATDDKTTVATVKATPAPETQSPAASSGWNNMAGIAFNSSGTGTLAPEPATTSSVTAPPTSATVASAVTAPDAAFAESPSLYLRTAQASKVHWRSWAPAAFTEAQSRQAAMLIVIGTSWDHNCNVMDAQVFDDAEISSLLNSDYVTVRVDADERPDVWSRYRMVYELINKQPATMPLTVYADAAGVPYDIVSAKLARSTESAVGLLEMAKQARDLYRSSPDDVKKQTASIESVLARLLVDPQTESAGSQADMLKGLTSAIARAAIEDGEGAVRGGRAAQALLASSAPANRGAGSELLLSRFRSGQRDHVLGGYFYRTPGLGSIQYGKLLPVQTEYITANAQAYGVSGKSLHKEAVGEVLRFCRDWLEAPEGGFYSSQAPDIDNDDNGSYFTWSADEIKAIAGTGSEATVFTTYLNAAAGQKANLHVTGRLQQAADAAGVSYEAANKALSAVRLKLSEARMNAEKIPMVDKSVQAGWNGDMIVAYLDAAKYTGDEQAGDFALKTANFIIESMISEKQGVARIMYKGRSQGFGYLEDNVKVAAALARCYEASGQKEYLDSAESLMEFVEAGFLDKSSGLYIDVLPSADSNGLVKLKRFPLEDEIACSSNAVAATTWLHLATHLGKPELKQRAERLINAAAVRRPFTTDTMASWAIALATLQNGILEYKK